MQFLMGLDDSYMQIRSSILSREVLPDMRSAYATISSEESHRVTVGSVVGSSQRNQASVFVSNVSNSQNFQSSNQNFSTGPSRPYNLNNNRQGGGSGLNNNSQGGGSGLVLSSGFTDEQMATLISLIKDNKVRKNMQANMAGANQHMIYTDKELGNVLDISHLKIEVGHPNGTKAYISKIGNLRLSNGLTLYDVMVIPEYCVTLIFVHKLVKENKVIVAFDENRCYFLNQDLNLKNILGIGDECEGLYYYNDQGYPIDPVLNVLKDTLPIDKKDNTVCCEICQRAKETREPFPLSDHTSKRLGDLDSEVEKNDSANVFQDVSHINFFDIEYPEMLNDDERVANDLNKGNSNSNISSMSGSNFNTTDFPVGSGNDADSSDGLVATQNEEVATLEENVFSEGNLDQNPSSTQGVQNVRRSSGEIDKYKARLVAQGFGQKEGIDYEETFSHVVKMVTVRCLLNIAMCMSWLVFQIDVNNSFLYGDLEEVVYMKPPEGYFPSDNKSDKGVFLALLVYMDDIIVTGNSISKIEKFKVFLKSKFMIKDLGKLKYFLGIEVVDTDKYIFLNQRKYVLNWLLEYGMLACKSTKTPLMSKLVISNEASENDPLLENVTDYQKLMRKLIYLTNTRPDISYAVHCLSHFMHSPLSCHLKISFKILRFLKSCSGLGIHIARTSGMFLNAYSDADWAKCIVTRKSVTGYCVLLNNSLVSWKSKKQNTLSKSSTEAKYRALASVTSEVIWILKILKDLQIEFFLPVSLHCDNNSAIKIAANPVFHERTKHLEIDLHFVREKILNGVVKSSVAKQGLQD
ncbi:ribonuclease H-like domain-containing protein [Tanacetum coccineum]